MKKTAFLFLLSTTLLISLTSCKAKEETQELYNDTMQSYENLKEEVSETSAKFTKTKDKVIETVDDLNTAIKEVEEAGDALKKIAE